MPSRPLLFLALALVACARPPPKFCAGTTTFDYDPASSYADMTAFPDDFYTVPDAASPAGLRVKVELSNAPWLQGLPTLQTGVYSKLSGLDGFGTSAGILLRFSGDLGKVPTGPSDSLSSKAIELVDLGPGGPVRVPFETQLTDDGAGIILWPMRPLRPKTRHAVIVTTRQPDAQGHCIAPSKPLQALLTGHDVPAALAPLAPRFQALLQALSLAPEEVSAAAVFTTQSIVEQTVTAAKDIASRTYAWKVKPVCDAGRGVPWRQCRGLFVAEDYRKDGVVVDGTPQATYDLPVALWLPKTPKPWPVVLFGHGLGSSKEQGEIVAEIAAPLGIATVAIDAPCHGEHPTARPDAAANPDAEVFDFFGVDAASGQLLPLVLRDHFREATYDKLQLLQLLRDVPDVDGDGVADLDLTRLAYDGYSLGGMMGSELLASAKGIGLAILTVPGARVATIASAGVNFSLVAQALETPGDPSSADRFFPVLQTILEKGDPVNWAPYVLGHRLPSAGATPPDLLVGEVIGDTTMPNAATSALARALGIPQLPPVLAPVGLVPVLASAPVAGNLDGVTAALFQFDRITWGSAEAPVAAEHTNILDGQENQVQARHFLQGWVEGQTPEVIDPYATLHTPPLGP